MLIGLACAAPLTVPEICQLDVDDVIDADLGRNPRLRPFLPDLEEYLNYTGREPWDDYMVEPLFFIDFAYGFPRQQKRAQLRMPVEAANFLIVEAGLRARVDVRAVLCKGGQRAALVVGWLRPLHLPAEPDLPVLLAVFHKLAGVGDQRPEGPEGTQERQERHEPYENDHVVNDERREQRQQHDELQREPEVPLPPWRWRLYVAFVENLAKEPLGFRPQPSPPRRAPSFDRRLPQDLGNQFGARHSSSGTRRGGCV